MLIGTITFSEIFGDVSTHYITYTVEEGRLIFSENFEYVFTFNGNMIDCLVDCDQSMGIDMYLVLKK